MATVKEEPADVTPSTNNSVPLPFTIDRYSSGSDNDAEEAREYLCKVIREEEETERAKRVRVLCGKAGGSESVGKRQRTGGDDVDGSLSTLVMPQLELATTTAAAAAAENGSEVGERGLGKVSSGGRQFWKAGDYEYVSGGDWLTTSAGMDHVRVHPRFLHSNATSHKWVLGAFAELLDNALDEVCNGATCVNIDTITNKKDGTPMLIVEDNGGGMDPDKMRQCMSLGYSAKSRIANTIGQYGNGFKTSTMRLGADVIVFSRCRGKDGKRPTQSIGLLSYTFLTRTGKEDIVVPMLDYERGAGKWKKLVRSTESDWEKNVDTIVQWSPFSSEEDLLCQFNLMTDHGTRVIIYNLWEDDQGQLELDFEADQHDIQIRGVNRDEKNIQMAAQYPNSRHFLTFRHSLRSYASILYLRIPDGFRIILRGRDAEHHDILNDLMHTQEITYRPQTTAEGVPKDPNMCAVVTLGFVMDAIHHIDVQGFNVYHKNRLIKPFWRIWNACGSDGRGVIGLLEANFVEPAHDKQGFERTTVLSRLENRLVTMQKQYWTKNCQLVGYVQRGGKKFTQSRQQGNSSDVQLGKSSQYKASGTSSGRPSPGQRPEKSTPGSNNVFDGDGRLPNGHIPGKMNNGKQPSNNGVELDSTMSSSLRSDHVFVGLDFEESDRALYGDEHLPDGHTPREIISGRNPHNNWMRPLPTMPSSSSSDMTDDMIDIYSNGTNQRPVSIDSACSHDSFMIDRLKEENCLLTERIREEEERILSELQQELEYEQEMSKSLQAQIDQVDRKIKRMGEEQNDLIDIFSEERERRVAEEENLKKQLEEESNAVQDLKEKIATFERK